MIDIFSIKDYKFPNDFLWGSSVSGHQVEGNNCNSNLWHREQAILKQNPSHEVSGMACNHYNMYEEDIKLLKTLGHRAFRLTVEWSRIEPVEGQFVQSEIDHYVRVLSSLKENGIQVFLTLIHFSVPQWFAEKGDFLKLENIKYFERYLNHILPIISPYVDFWNVINEFNLGMTEEKLDFKFNSVIYHARGYHLIKQYSNKPVSSAHAMANYYPKRQHDIFDKAIQQYLDVANNEFFFHAIRTGELVLPHKESMYDREIKDTVDFWSINLYTRDIIDARIPEFSSKRYDFSHAKMIPMDFYLDEFFAEAMYHNLMRLMDKTIYITENGCSCVDDKFRIVYITEYLTAMNQAIREGVDVRGYLYWSLLDNYEFTSFTPQFGLVEVDRNNNFKRTPKPSAYFYKEIIENNGFSQEILRKYLSEMPKFNNEY